MGAKVQEAVSFHSQQTDINLLRLLGILAAGADDETGLIDPAPRRDTLAKLTGCDERTLTNRINRLVKSGELERTRVGSGPGNPSAYRILLPLPETTYLKGENAKGEKGESLAQKVDRLEQEMGEIKALFFTLLGEKGERKGEKGEKGEGERVKGGNPKGESGSPGSVQTILSDPKEEDHTTTLTATPMGEKGEATPEDSEVAYQTAVQASLDLLDYWQDLTGSFAPNDPEKRKQDYIGPLNRLWIRCDRNTDQAKTLLKENRQQMLDGGKTPFRPAAIVPAIIAKLDAQATGTRPVAGIPLIQSTSKGW
jgi:hypothetical protein